MALTFADLLVAAARHEGRTWDATAAGGTSDFSTESLKYQLVEMVNAGIRWYTQEADPEFAWPETVADNAAVTVTSGVVALTDLVDASGVASWCSLWTADPRTASSTAEPVYGVLSNDGVHLQAPHGSLATVFAFYRKKPNVGTYLAASAYGTPSDIPNQWREPVALKAAALRLASEGKFKESMLREEQALDWLNSRKAGLLNGGNVAWSGHGMVLW
jgi:hypothetical protein